MVLYLYCADCRTESACCPHGLILTFVIFGKRGTFGCGRRSLYEYIKVPAWHGAPFKGTS